MKIIDAQIHIWSQTVTPPSGTHRKVEKFTAEQALAEMDEAGVDAALIHPPYSWDPTSNQMALDAAAKYPDRFAVMGQFELDDPESRRRIVGWRRQPGMMGLRWALLTARASRLMVTKATGAPVKAVGTRDNATRSRSPAKISRTMVNPSAEPKP